MKFLSFFTSNGYIYELIFAFLPLLPCVKRRKGWQFELIPLLVLIVVVSYFLYGNIGEWNIFLASLYYLCVFGYLTFTVEICSEDGWKKALFVSCCALIFQHIFYILFKAARSLLVVCEADGPVLDFVLYLILMVCTYTAMYFLFVKNIEKYETPKIGWAGVVTVSALTFVFAVPLNLYFQRLFARSGAEYGAPNAVFSLVGGVVCAFALVLLFYLQRGAKIKEELDVTKAVQESERKQYEVFKQSMETLNIKYHDLKYSLTNRGNGEKEKKDEKWTQETKQALDVCGTMQNTGNATLDSILVEKRFECDALEIQFESEVLDGSLLSKMEEVDIYSVFGNALDNAIECLQKVSKEKRFLRLNLSRVNGMAKIQVENYTPTALDIKTGISGSSKKFKGVHGFGVKSIERTIQKYNGFIHYTTEDDIFILVIIFPCNKDAD